MEGLIPLIIFGLVIYMIFKAFRPLKISSDKTLEAYQNKYPNNNKNGKVTCYQCSTSDIWMKPRRGTPSGVIHAHLCKQCGTELYRSVLKY